MAHPILVKMEGITKKFPGVIANENVNLEIRAGEIHALLGENGAGKSTLMNILTGLYKADTGQIMIKGRPMHFKSPKDAIDAGIGMIHQHFRLVASLSVAENVILGYDTKSFWLNKKKIIQAIREISQKYNLSLDPQAKIWQLSVGEQQRVEIVKSLFRGSDILILDEPTAVLTPQESRDLFATLKKMTAGGKAVIVITHKMQEVMDMADRVTVLRGGKSISTLEKNNTNKEELAQLMVGHEIPEDRNHRVRHEPTPIIKLENIRALNDKGLPGLIDISLQINGGEIIGVAGVAGNGQRELAEVLTGLRSIYQGKIMLDGQDYTGKLPRDFIKAGIAHVPEDRLGMGLVPNLGAVDNVMLKKYYKSLTGLFLNYAPVRRETKTMVEDFNIKLSALDSPVKLMSGGNLQKLLLAREISTNPRVMIAVYPVRGLDIGATESVRSLLLAQRNEGVGILLISEDLDEIINLSDRIIVLYEGKIMGEEFPETTTKEKLGYFMTGVPTPEEDIIS
ncbi:ABC transporter ATP-binding protein [Dehalobacterium formicoaceticum]|uniref:ABC transporter ATP-binding protein n=1 Tax=Dehalobacterium formicoaceticum TaxID=51515 RepID=A0ABT1Y4V8_9FIRM|nr:ABC transporter ATP-binding protein [Dehalobacterium formicoaceticum]MCR6545588.1 ABC transporter ATP-binding protein [Dehalobacterium formicoaceticum]